MKKVLASIVAIVYLSTSMGATVHFHYCMGKLISWSFIDHESRHCSSCGMPKQIATGNTITSKGGCCTDEDQLIKTNDDQKVAQSDIQFVKLTPSVPATGLPVTTAVWLSSPAVEYPNTHAPPGSGKCPLFIRYRNFRL